MNPLKKPLAVIDKNLPTTWLLERNLSSRFLVDKFISLADFLQCQDKPYSAVLGDFDTLNETPALLEDSSSELRRDKCAIFTDRKASVFLPSMEAWSIYCAIPKNTPNPHEQIVPIENLIEPLDGFGLMRYFNYTFQMFRKDVNNREEKKSITGRIIDHFETCGYDVQGLYDVRLVLEEMINNSFFHAFTNGDGREKYDSGMFEELDKDEKVYVEFGSDSKFAGFSICDNQGRLRPEQVISNLSRQILQEGIFDHSGRGIYLSRRLTSQLIYNIHRGYRTQVICLFYARAVNSLKPLCINYHEGDPPDPTSILDLSEFPESENVL